MTFFNRLVLGVIGAATLCVFAAPAGAATTTVGDAPIPDQTCAANYLHWNTSAPYVVGAAGTITQLSSFVGSAPAFPVTLSLKVLRPSTNTIVGGTGVITANSIGPVSEAVSIPVQPGDVLGIWNGQQFDCDRIAGGADLGLEVATVNPPLGPIPGAPTPFSSRRYSVAATLVTPDPPVTPATCTVPALKGKTKSAASTALNKAGCKLGKTKKKKLRRFTKKQKRNRVRSQSRPAGSVAPSGTAVDITINVKKKKK